MHEINLSSFDSIKLNNPNIIIEKLADGSTSFSYQNEYRIDPEHYSQWPKFHSLILDEKNQQIVSLLFKFHDLPNFKPILKVCSLFEAICDYREIGKIPSQTLIRISYNSIPVIAYLGNVYNRFSNESSAILDHILIYMIEDQLDKTTPTWKLDISLNIRSEYDLSIQDHLENQYSKTPPMYYTTSDKPDTSRICPLLQKLDPTVEKLKFEQMKNEYILENVIQVKYLFTPKMIKEMAYYKKFDTIENFFNTTDKCNDYLYKKNTYIQEAVEEMQSNLEQQLLKLFTPNTLEKIADALLSDTTLKNAKSGNTLVGASTDLVVNAIQAMKNLPVINVIFTTLSLAKVAVSSADLLKRNGVINISGKFEANFAELSKSFICKVTICSLNNFVKLSSEGRKVLTDFYTKFIYTSITKDPHQFPSESYLASNLLEKLSNPSYLEKLDLKKELSITIENTDDTTISIFDYVSGYNQTTCYAGVLHDLMGDHTSLT